MRHLAGKYLRNDQFFGRCRCLVSHRFADGPSALPVDVRTPQERRSVGPSVIAEDLCAQRVRESYVLPALSQKAYGSAGRWPALAAQGISRIDARACLQACASCWKCLRGGDLFGRCRCREPLLCGRAVRAPRDVRAPQERRAQAVSVIAEDLRAQRLAWLFDARSYR